jgi:hypothetical protein
MFEKRFIGVIKRNKDIIVLVAVVMLLIVIVIILTNRMIMQMERNALGYVFRLTSTSLSTSFPGEHDFQSEFLFIQNKPFLQ